MKRRMKKNRKSLSRFLRSGMAEQRDRNLMIVPLAQAAGHPIQHGLPFCG